MGSVVNCKRELKNKVKKFLSILMSAALIVSLLTPMSVVWAEEADAAGENISISTEKNEQQELLEKVNPEGAGDTEKVTEEGAEEAAQEGGEEAAQEGAEEVPGEGADIPALQFIDPN